MKPIDLQWVKTWAASSAIDAVDNGLLAISYREAPKTRIVVNTESIHPASLVLLANRLIQWDEVNKLSEQDRTYVFWIRESGIWTDVNESIASETFSTLLKGYGQPGRTRGLLFESGEPCAAAAFALVAMLFGWDAYLIPLSCRFIGHISHHGHVELRAGDNETMRQLFDCVSAWGAMIEPVPEAENRRSLD